MLTGQYDVFISHAGPQKNFALWVRSHIRICGYLAFVDERDLRCEPVAGVNAALYPHALPGGPCGAVIVHLDSTACRRWISHDTQPFHLRRYGGHAPAAMEHALRGASAVLVIMTRDFLRSKYCLEELRWACDQMQRGRQPLSIIPIFYHDQDPRVGFGVNAFERSALTELLRQQHAAASDRQRTQWLEALLLLAKRTGIRQDSTGRCVPQLAGRHRPLISMTIRAGGVLPLASW